jgi:hypothetical protein
MITREIANEARDNMNVIVLTNESRGWIGEIWVEKALFGADAAKWSVAEH